MAFSEEFLNTHQSDEPGASSPAAVTRTHTVSGAQGNTACGRGRDDSAARGSAASTSPTLDARASVAVPASTLPPGIRHALAVAGIDLTAAAMLSPRIEFSPASGLPYAATLTWPSGRWAGSCVVSRRAATAELVRMVSAALAEQSRSAA